MKTITEGKAIIKVPDSDKISKEMDVFYNPDMKNNRDIAVLVLNSLDIYPSEKGKEKLIIADIMAGTGIRTIRFLLETKKVEEIHVNDFSEKSVKLIKENLKLNKINFNRISQNKNMDDKNRNDKIKISNFDANLFLLNSKGFNYIDIDPFGSPIKFLDSAISRISRNGILAVTATDTSALSGTYKSACSRKYWAVPLRNYMMHETGLRILARRCQLIGAMHDKALIPVFSHATLHYSRIYFRVIKGKKQVDRVLKQHKYFHYCKSCMNREVSEKNRLNCCNKEMLYSGPLWTGRLWDLKLAGRMRKSNKTEKNKTKFSDLDTMLHAINKESKINNAGFYSLHKISSKLKTHSPKTIEIVNELKKKGFKTSPTHFAGDGIRTNAGIKEIEKAFKKVMKRKS